MRWFGSTVAAALLVSGAAHAEIAGGKVKIGVLTDMSGVYAEGLGTGIVDAARMAAEEFGGKINGVPIEVISADHQNKPDVGTSLASRWYDVEGVNVITDVGISSVAFAVRDIALSKNKTLMLVSTGSADLTGKLCAPDNMVHWVYDTYQLGASIGNAVPMLGKKWFMLNADYSFGAALEAGVVAALKKNGAEVVGSTKHPLSNQDFSAFILQAQRANPDVVALNNGGDDTANAIKSAREFGLKAKLVGFGMETPSLIKAMTLQTGQGVMFVNSWVQRDDAETKAWLAKFMERNKKAPSSYQVGNYSVVRSYLKAVQAANSTDSKAVIAKMREMPVRDVFTQDGYLRPDGRMVHSVALMQIKSPAESKHEWDLSKVVGLLKGDDVFRPLAEGGCPAIK